MSTRFMFISALDVTRPEVEAGHAPLGLGYLASSLREAFGPDYFAFKVVERDVEREIAAFHPDVVAISAVTPNYGRAAAYASIAKTLELPVIMGGIHISTLPSSLTDNMDVGVVGEGERTIVDLLTLYEADGCFTPDALERVDGVVFKRGEKRISTRRRAPIEPLDQIPLPARELLAFDEMTMVTSRGCPYNCVYCSTSCFWGNIRYFSADYVVNEIAHLIENYTFKLNYICIWDDLFIADVNRLRKIVALLDERGLLGQLRFFCHARSNLVNDEVVDLLHRLGVRLVSMGFESANPRTLNYLKGGTITVEDHKNALRAFRRRGIDPMCSFVIGAPHETKPELLRSLRFVRRHRVRVDPYLLTPYPGTQVWDYALKRGLVSESMDWDLLKIDRIKYSDDAIILSEHLSREEVYELFRRFKNEQRRRIREKKLRWALRHPVKASESVLRRVRQELT